MANKAKKAVKAKRPAKTAAKKRGSRNAARLAQAMPFHQTPREQGLSWAIQASYGAHRPAREIVADAKVFEEYLAGGGLRK